MESKGILTIASGDYNYGAYACNLAASIKCNDPDVKLAVITDGAASDAIHERAKLFDQILAAPKEEPLKLKLMIDKMTPFEHTVFLDADTIVIPGKKLKRLFHDSDLQIGTRDRFKLSDRFDSEGKCRMQWLPHLDITSLECMSEDPWFYNLSSEVMSLRKSTLVDAIFEEALYWYDNPPKGFTRFGQNIPDEMPLQLSIVRNDIQMECPWLPSCWRSRKHTNAIQLMQSDYILYSMGGAQLDASQKKIFTDWSGEYMKHMGFSWAWKPESKSSFDPFRKKR